MLLQLWDIESAPEPLRCVVGESHPGGWLAFINGSYDEVIEELIASWNLAGLTVATYRLDGVGVVLAGLHRRLRRPAFPDIDGPLLS